MFASGVITHHAWRVFPSWIRVSYSHLGTALEAISILTEPLGEGKIPLAALHLMSCHDSERDEPDLKAVRSATEQQIPTCAGIYLLEDYFVAKGLLE